MEVLQIIAKKRDGIILSNDEIVFIVDQYTKNKMPDYQMSAFLMAIYINGMTKEETINLTTAMMHSGDLIDLTSLESKTVDKHSTGGVGDKVSLVLAPLVRYFKMTMAKMSGRGLGHTGGTIDKLESIPGFKVEYPTDTFLDLVKKERVAIISQTGDIAPADKKLYALRDVTETVSAIPLIASSIMSKKLASGTDIIVLDVKVGNGAFMKDLTQAETLARLMVEIGSAHNKEIVALLSYMGEPLGYKIGNALEVIETIETLKGNGPKDLVEVVSVITAHLGYMSNVFNSLEEGITKTKEVLNQGLAFEELINFVRAQEGDVSYILEPNKLIEGVSILEVFAQKSGYVKSIESEQIGHSAMLLGAGRQNKDDVLNLKVGLELLVKIGDHVNEGDLIGKIYHNDKGLAEAIKYFNESIEFSNDKVARPNLIEKTITK